MVKIQKLIRVKDRLSKHIHKLTGEKIIPKNAYEKNICEHLGWKLFDDRHYDAYCIDNDTFIEMKKGQASMHFDMIRYSQIVLGFGKKDTVTVFFRWNKKKKEVIEAFVIDTDRIIEFLKIDVTKAKQCLAIQRQVPRQLNMLASATLTDLRTMASFVVKNLHKPKKTFIKLRINKQ